VREWSGGQPRRKLRHPGPTARMLLLTVPALAACAVGFAVAPHEDLLSLSTAALAVCAVVGTRVSLDLEGTLFWDGSFLPIACAAALLGPAPTAAVTFASELSVFRIERYRAPIFLLNLVGTVAPNMAAAWILETSGHRQDELVFYGVFGLVICAAIVANGAIITALAGIFYEVPVLSRMRQHIHFAPAIGINVVLAVAAVAVYRSEGMAGALFIIAGVFVFAYIARRLKIEQAQRTEIEQLARSRGRLVAQLLEAEDRERRALAQSLHDDVVQTLLVARQDLLDALPMGHDRLEPVLSHLDDATRQVRGAIAATHPSVLEQVGLRGALTAIAEHAASRGGFAIDIDVEEGATGIHDRLLFSSARELLANAARHSSATRVVIAVGADDGTVTLSVRDDGIGFNGISQSAIEDGHIGLQSVAERVEAIGGKLSIRSEATWGTEAIIHLPKQNHDTFSAASLASLPKQPHTSELLTSISEHE
jgi:two-component system, NarL family, sensor kinase